MNKAGFPFIALGVVFIALGTTTNRTFFFVGLPFFCIGFALLLRSRWR